MFFLFVSSLFHARTLMATFVFFFLMFATFSFSPFLVTLFFLPSLYALEG